MPESPSSAAPTAPPPAAVEAIAEAGRWLDARGWCPATAGNISLRLAGGLAAITVSGRHKGRLGPADVMLVDAEGRAVATRLRPSAETGLHCALYRRFAECAAVLHGHSVPATLLSRRIAAPELVLEGYELLKVFRGIDTHAVRVALPLFDNDQDISRLARRIDAYLDARAATGGASGPLLAPAYLIRGHGVYVWGRDMAEAMRHMEGLEFLLACELEARRIAP
ncbi:MAG: methylthioribulose 1-phosphate dehydratase [Alphaproteobacteria bacterium]|nr:methylthioribulose 1-phosphate dehydratase [Alphaproteobacteria bacterium]